MSLPAQRNRSLFCEEYAMTRVFVLTNHKGGVGKSTSATTIALGIAALLRRAGASNSRVLLIDTDSQGHATLITQARKTTVSTTASTPFSQQIVRLPLRPLRIALSPRPGTLICMCCLPLVS